MADLALHFVRFLLYLLRSAWGRIRALRSSSWHLTDAVVTRDPQCLDGFGGKTIEFPYSYRFGGELYTGLHEEPCLLSRVDYMERFAKGSHFLVRVRPDDPEISLVRDGDQAHSLQRT